MAHPEGGSGSKFDARHAFSEAYAFVGAQGTTYKSTTGEQITAKQGFARDKDYAHDCLSRPLLKNSCLAVEAWAREKNIGFEL